VAAETFGPLSKEVAQAQLEFRLQTGGFNLLSAKEGLIYWACALGLEASNVSYCCFSRAASSGREACR
jgi:hypothetical protein